MQPITIWVMRPHDEFMATKEIQVEHTLDGVMRAAAFAAGLTFNENWEIEIFSIYKRPFNLEIYTNNPAMLVQIGMAIRSDEIHSLDPDVIRNLETYKSTN